MRYLKIVNLTGLVIVMVSLIVSFNHIRRERSWDRHNTHADRIVRLTLVPEGQPVDGRIWGNILDDAISQVPQVEAVAKLHEVYRPDMLYNGIFITADSKTFYINEAFLRTFDIPMLDGGSGSALNAPGDVIISESFARKLSMVGDNFSNAAEDSESGGVVGSGLRMEGNDYRITGIFKDIPATSHWHGDVIALMPDNMQWYNYTYLLLKDDSDIGDVEQELTDLIASMFPEGETPPAAALMPLTDIHLHSRNLCEVGINGNIAYIWLILGANALLLIVVLFNLWLNTSLIFSWRRRFYQLHRLHGAPESVIIRSEAAQALVLSIIACGIGIGLSWLIFDCGLTEGSLNWRTTVAVAGIFIVLTVAVSLIPSLRNMAATRFLNSGDDMKPVRFSYANIRWMLTVQYAVVIAVLVLALGISKQLSTIESIQAGGDGSDVMVHDGLTEEVMEKYPLLRERLDGSPLIKGFTTCFQIPGDAIRDRVSVRRSGSVDEGTVMPCMVVGEGFLDIYDIPLLAGKDFAPLNYSFGMEQEMMYYRMMYDQISDRSEEYIINSKALTALGFSSPEEAVGTSVEIDHGMINYIARGTIVGVTDDYNYTGVFESNTPLIMLHRQLFQFCVMVRVDPLHKEEAMKTLEVAWNEVYPDRRSAFVPLSDIYRSLYRNEFNARELVLVFCLLCFLIADLGLIVFMAFIIRRRTKEIAIRKIHGATAGGIVRMLNGNFLRYISIAFVVAVPVAWLVLHTWLQRFAYKTTLDWWIFAASGLAVLLLSLISVSLQSWHAATLKPVDGIRKE